MLDLSFLNILSLSYIVSHLIFNLVVMAEYGLELNFGPNTITYELVRTIHSIQASATSNFGLQGVYHATPFAISIHSS